MARSPESAGPAVWQCDESCCGLVRFVHNASLCLSLISDPPSLRVSWQEVLLKWRVAGPHILPLVVVSTHLAKEPGFDTSQEAPRVCCP